MKINWAQKLSSRKFWAAAVGYVSTMLAAFNVADSIVMQVTCILSSAGMLAVYVLSEAKVDAARGKSVSDYEKI